MLRPKRLLQVVLLLASLLFLMGAGDDSARFNYLGHRLMCACGCNQVLLECNHVGCTYSDRMRTELASAMDRGENDSLVLQDFVQKYGTTVVLVPAVTGFGSLAWIMPYVALIFGVGAVLFIVRVWNKRGPNAVAAGGATVAPHDAMDSFRDQVRRDTEL
jgi:cytochrome c-type biogenesis protein CcmH